MSLPTDDRASTIILRDARYHRASIKADPTTAHLAERVETGERVLRDAAQATEAAEDARVEAYARLVRADYALDARTRRVELEVLTAVLRDRSTPGYRACFPQGLTALIALRGEEQERATRSLVAALGVHFPDVAAAHGAALTELAAAAVTAERAWLETERLLSAAMGDERLARVELIRALQRNEGALIELFPGDKRQAKSYFRKSARRGRKGDPSGEE
ncbi:hypothetical protein [Sandaracinus amylolyticus]|uniref:Uncharacterized protein n=1 Tax=Sandaracinus amylolyticus TaxID=927083 RepID=A0A0F6YNT5_9BACT|nr:hypothetical protein [Sandaracinus amylolyticus]AKF10707.1 hypothetical protein DB32_007856 [Sandaracinus amylolyticus]